MCYTLSLSDYVKHLTMADQVFIVYKLYKHEGINIPVAQAIFHSLNEAIRCADGVETPRATAAPVKDGDRFVVMAIFGSGGVGYDPLLPTKYL
jgi:hypothetical protein